MGYTHYFYQHRDLRDDEWRALCGGCQRMLTIPEMPPLSRGESFPVPPEITDDVICFNGVGDDGHETFVVYRTKTDPWTGEPSEKEEVFQFCKTAYKPYDLPVTAILAYLDSTFPDAFVISSDGGPDDWTDGIELARRAWPQVDIDLPRSLTEKDDEAELA
jgi:hypothetical protein